jgi:O-methyltransferase
MTPLVKAVIRWAFTKFGYQIRPLPKGSPKVSPFWDYDADFNRLHQQLIGYTVVSKERCFMIYQLARQAAHIPGDVAEVGVYKGGTAKLLARVFASSDKSIHLFDTFSGMPPPNPEKDFIKKGAFGDTNLERVKGYLNDCEDILLYKGIFPETAKSIEDRMFCFAHIDADIYRSVMDCCEFFYPRLQNGGIMIFDDYGDRSCPGAKAAVDEFFADKVEMLCYLTTGQCIVIRLWEEFGSAVDLAGHSGAVLGDTSPPEVATHNAR